MKLNNTSSGTAENPFKGWLLVFLLFHALLSLGLIYKGILTVGAYIKAGNLLGLLMIGYFFLPASIVLLLQKKKTLFRVFYILYAVFFLLGTIDPANLSSSLVAGIIATAVLAGPWLVYIFRSRRLEAFFNSSDDDDTAGKNASTDFEKYGD